jgi:hypothetical protein
MVADNGNRLIFEIWWNFCYDLFSIKNVADINSIDSFVSKQNMEEFQYGGSFKVEPVAQNVASFQTSSI